MEEASELDTAVSNAVGGAVAVILAVAAEVEPATFVTVRVKMTVPGLLKGAVEALLPAVTAIEAGARLPLFVTRAATQAFDPQV